VGTDGVPHERADRNAVRRLQEILAPPPNPQEQHREDENSKWFGVDGDEAGRPIFQDYGLYAALVSGMSPDVGTLYPSLVSFVGQTGSGKSTLVKTLIDQQARSVDESWQTDFASPVVGSPTDVYTPTSADVHLYADPATCRDQYPLLYAHREGLDGGEQAPISLQCCVARLNRQGLRGSDARRRAAAARHARSSHRTLDWADSPEKRKRQYADTELYPRLLYTFSNIIVFVVRNDK
jgi:hypothetical protein